MADAVMGAEDNHKGPAQVKPEQRMAPVNGSAGRNAPTATDSHTTHIMRMNGTFGDAKLMETSIAQ